MAYVNTGNKRSLTFTLTKKISGVVQVGYPKTYDGRLAFLGYAAITDEEARRLTDSAYNARLTAFQSYVENIEAGFDAATDATNDPSVADAGTCPPPPTTTTSTTII